MAAAALAAAILDPAGQLRRNGDCHLSAAGVGCLFDMLTSPAQPAIQAAADAVLAEILA